MRGKPSRKGDPAPGVSRVLPPGAVLRMAVCSWDHFEVEPPMGYPVLMKHLEGCIGYCEVFANREAAEKVYGPAVALMGLRQIDMGIDQTAPVARKSTRSAGERRGR